MANNITVRGKVPKNHDFSVKFTTNGKQFGTFTVADSRNTARKDEEPIFVTQYWDVQVWGTAVDAVAQLNAEDKIKIEGSAELGEYEHKTLKKEDGTPYKVRTSRIVLTRAEQIQREIGRDEENRPQYGPVVTGDEDFF